MRYAACIEYDGSCFSGWQRQKNHVRTVQQNVEEALSKVADHEVAIITAGRTDASVHASHQIIHFDSDAQRSEFAWCRGANRFLDKDVRLIWVQQVDSEFHARFSALTRSYRFIIYNNPVASAILRNLSTLEHLPLDVNKMSDAGNHLLGVHDFSSFRAAGCQAHSPIREMTRFEINQVGPWIWFDVTANAFLQHMVRNIAGVLIEIGQGAQPVEWISKVLAAKDRKRAAITARPHGLYLVGVTYPEQFKLPTTERLVHYWGTSPSDSPLDSISAPFKD